MQILGSIFAGLLGLALGSFLNVCLSRWPQGESVVTPGSHCRNCEHTLAWWENLPLVSWLALRGRCKGCGTAIGRRYPLVEFSIGTAAAYYTWNLLAGFGYEAATADLPAGLFLVVGKVLFVWLMSALAVLDAEHFWLPDWLTLPGIALGIAFRFLLWTWVEHGHPTLHFEPAPLDLYWASLLWLLGVGAAAASVLAIRGVYWLIRRREGLGLGDVKLMALLAAWLGFPAAMLSLLFAAILGSIVGLVLLARATPNREPGAWAAVKLPLGTFLCIGGLIAALWGQPILSAYMRWAGLAE